MPNTPRGFPYPIPDDPVSLGAANIRALAEAVDAKVPPAAQRRANAVQGIPSAVLTGITLPVISFDTNVMTATAGRIICVTPGYYLVTASLRWTAGSAGLRNLIVFLNSGSDVRIVDHQVLPPQIDHNVAALVYMAAGNYVWPGVYQDSGVGLNIAWTIDTAARISAVRVTG